MTSRRSLALAERQQDARSRRKKWRGYKKLRRWLEFLPYRVEAFNGLTYLLVAMVLIQALSSALVLALSASAQQPISDPGTAGVTPEIVFLYNDEWPTGIAVSASGRKFSNYPPALDPTDQRYTVAELIGNNTQTPYPSAEMNSPPGGRINYSTYPATGANTPDYLVGVQSVVVDPADRLWILDTGRVATANGTMLGAAYGGPKLIGVNLTTDKIFKTIVFTPDAAPADSVSAFHISIALLMTDAFSTSTIYALISHPL